MASITPGQIYQMITGVGDAFEGSFKESRQRGLDDEAEGAASRLLGRQSGAAKSTSPAMNFGDLGSDEGPKFNTAGKLPTFAGGDTNRPMTMPPSPELAKAIQEHATRAGIDPVDLATAISYETAGTFDPWKAGPTTKWGQHRGLIQWGEPQAKQYGVREDMPVGEQVAAAVKYLQDRGVKPGMGLMDIYSAINAGSVGRYDASDEAAGGAPGTVADKVNNQMAGHRKKAQTLLASFGGQPNASAADAPAPGAQNAQFVIPGQSTAGSDLTADEYRDLRLMMRSEKTRPLAVQILNEREALAAEGRKRQYELQDRAEQRSYDERVRRQGWTREDEIRAANQKREDGIRQGTWTREDEIRHKTWEREDRLKKEDRTYQETAPTPDMKEYNFYVQQEQAANREPQDFTSWQRANKKSGATTIGNIGGQAIEPEFNKTTGKAIGERFDAISKEGDSARSDLAMVDQLRSLGGAINFKTMPALRGALAEYGVKIGDDVGEIQAYNSIIDKLTPAQRIPGTGASSDLDVKMFKSALPRLINTPEGNALIMDVMQAMGEDKIARAVIAERAQTGEVTPAQAINELRAMPSPLAAYKDRIEEAAKSAQEADSPAAPGKRVQIPQGYTAARVLSEAKETYGRANEAQKALIRERVRSYGIDPKRLDN